MKKMMKRIGAVLLAVAMMAALSMSAWATGDTGGNTSNPDPAAGGTTPAATSNVNSTNLNGAPKEGDKGTVTISGLENGDKVTFYQIVDAQYLTTGSKPFEKYVNVAEPTKALFDANNNAIYPSAAELTALANNDTFKNAATTVKVGPVTAANNKVEQELDIGEWMALITAKDGSTKVYNPMVVSTYYANNDGTQVVEGGKIDVSTDSYTINGTTSYAKSSEPEIDKSILGNSVGDNNEDSEDANGTVVGQHTNGDNGDDHKVGDTVTFQVVTQIPSYSDDYVKNIVYKISDKMDKGLTMGSITSVTVGTTAVTASNEINTTTTPGTFTQDVTATAEGGFTLTFADQFLRDHAMETVVVVYTATINSDATVGFDPTTNTAKVEYSNNPENTQDTETKEDNTHHYTFAIDGNITGEEDSVTINQSKKKWGRELIKVNENGQPDENAVSWIETGESPLETTTTQGQKVKYGLAGAEFELVQTKDENGKEIDKSGMTDEQKAKFVYTATTSANGYFIKDSTHTGFTQLDAGTYVLQETAAPSGYTLDSTTHEVVISATYNENGTLNTYTISIDGQATTTYTATYQGDTSVTVNDVVITDLGIDPRQTFYIKNTPTKELPSTGGIGTYVFTVAGVAIMVVAAGLLIVRHKKKT